MLARPAAPLAACVQRISSVDYKHSFNGPLSRISRVSRYQKGRTNLDFSEARDSECSGIGWAICKSAPRSRQINWCARARVCVCVTVDDDDHYC